MEADPRLASHVREGAADVEQSFITSEALADYLVEVLRRAGRKFFSDVLDDACTARDFFATRVDCAALGELAMFDLRDDGATKRGRSPEAYGTGCRLIVEHLTEQCGDASS